MFQKSGTQKTAEQQEYVYNRTIYGKFGLTEAV